MLVQAYQKAIVIIKVAMRELMDAAYGYKAFVDRINKRASIKQRF
jgi:hypothetical protein